MKLNEVYFQNQVLDNIFEDLDEDIINLREREWDYNIFLNSFLSPNWNNMI